ncbi:MAG: PH domain-containing protein [Armatimonadetes bacterium]|nr:PH domain-containing protein [Armatimonadota bacterium]
MSEPVFRRLHPLTIVVELFKVVGRWIIFFAFLAYQRITSGEGSAENFWIEALGGVAVLAAVARYYSYTFAIHNGHLHIRSGIFVRQNRTIPLDRIQNINLQRTVVHRILGLVDLRIETAAGIGTEASLSALDLEEAARVRKQLAQHIEQTKPDDPAQGGYSAPKSVYRITQRELILAGVTENRALAIMGSLAGLSFFFQGQLAPIRQRFLDTGIEMWALVTASIVILLVVGCLFSIVSTFVTYGNFVLTREDGRLRRKYGLLTQVESVVPLSRVQVMRTTETLIQRALKLCKLYVETAGSFSEKDMGGSSLVSPLLESKRLPTIARSVLPDKLDQPLIWKPVSKRTVRKHFQVRLVGFGVLIAVSSFFFGPVAFYALIPAALLAWLTGVIAYKTLAYGIGEKVLGSRLGLLNRWTWYVPHEKIQAVTMRQSPFQRRLDLISVSLFTGASGPGSVASVIDLRSADAENLADLAHQRSIRTGRPTGDGL